MRTRWCLPSPRCVDRLRRSRRRARDRRRRRCEAPRQPRHVAVSKDGDVYVAESGRGGDHATAKSCFDSAEGFACTGRTGAVTRIGRWGQHRIVSGLASFAPATGDNAIGPHGVFVDGQRRLRDERRPDRSHPRHPAAGRPARPDARRRGPDLGAVRQAPEDPPLRPRPGDRRRLEVRARRQPRRAGRQPAHRQQPGRRARRPRALRDRRRGRQQRHPHRPSRPARGPERLPEHPARADGRCRPCPPAWSRDPTVLTT